MKDRHTQQAERVARQATIDSRFIEPTWSKLVDIPLIEMSMMMPIPQVPIVLLPEMRFSSLLRMVLECFPKVGKMMIVDSSNSRFEMLRNRFADSGPSLYFSAQNLNALNYSNDVFNNVITEISLPTLSLAPSILHEYSRVLRPGGRIVTAIPLWGSFPQFFDILLECILKLSPTEAHSLKIQEQMSPDYFSNVLKNAHFHMDGHEIAEFELPFPNTEQLLFSTLVETSFLSYCLSIPLEYTDPRQLLMLTVRAFHHYFQNEPLTLPMRIGLYAAVKE